MGPAANGAVRPVRELIERWCAAYGDLDEKKLAALESPDIEMVDRFGELHTAKQRSDEERFWAEGFETIRREDFHPVCTIEEIRSTGPDVMIVHAEISYPGGIRLNGGDYITAFSEMHTFVVLRDEEDWRIAGHDITTRE
jgi:ketosteroid isomerase-like protein